MDINKLNSSQTTDKQAENHLYHQSSVQISHESLNDKPNYYQQDNNNDSQFTSQQQDYRQGRTVLFIAFAVLLLFSIFSQLIVMLLKPLANAGLGMEISYILSALCCYWPLVWFLQGANLGARQVLVLNNISLRQILFCLSMGVLARLALFLVISLPKTSQVGQLETLFLQGDQELMLLIILVIAPILEEVLFRGLCFFALEKFALPNTLIIIITAGIWAFMHGLSPRHEQWLIFLMGCLLGYLRVKMRSLYACVACHAGFNAGTYALLLP